MSEKLSFHGALDDAQAGLGRDANVATAGLTRPVPRPVPAAMPGDTWVPCPALIFFGDRQAGRLTSSLGVEHGVDLGGGSVNHHIVAIGQLGMATATRHPACKR